MTIPVILPRFIRLRDALAYLGMDRHRFNYEVRPHLTEIPIGEQGIGFDRLDLDAWADEYKSCNGRRAKGEKPCQPSKKERQVSSNVVRPGTSTNGSEVADFARALERATSRRRRDTSPASQLEEIRKAEVYGVRPRRTFRQAATKYLNECRKASIADDALFLKALDPYIGGLPLESVHMGMLSAFIAAKKDTGLKTRSINHHLKVVRHILNLAAGEWMDEYGLTWLSAAPKIKLLPEHDLRKPYPLSWDEQAALFKQLPITW